MGGLVTCANWRNNRSDRSSKTAPPWACHHPSNPRLSTLAMASNLIAFLKTYLKHLLVEVYLFGSTGRSTGHVSSNVLSVLTAIACRGDWFSVAHRCLWYERFVRSRHQLPRSDLDQHASPSPIRGRNDRHHPRRQVHKATSVVTQRGPQTISVQ